MAASITVREAMTEFVERYALGTVVPLSAATASSFTLTTAGSPELRGPFSSAGIPVGSPVIVTAETTGTGVTGNRTFVSDWEPSTGVLSVSPDVADTDSTEIIVFDKAKGVYDAIRVVEAISRAHQNHGGRWELRPLTYVPDGDMQALTVADYWTAAANGVASYVSAQVFPATQAVGDAAGQVGLSRMVQLVSSGGSTSMDSTGIRVVPTTELNTWYFRTAIRLVSGAGTVTFSIRDNTNTAGITAQVTRGNDSSTLTTTRFGDFLILEGTFDKPATCDEIAFRLALSATGMTAQLAPLIAFPINATSFPLPDRIRTHEHIGNFFMPLTLRGPGGLPDVDMGDPLTEWGRTHAFTDYGDHMTVSFNFEPGRAVFYEENVFGRALTAMADTTTVPMERLLRWAYYELIDHLWRDDVAQGLRAGNGSLLPSKWQRLRNAALMDAGWSTYEPAQPHVVGRR